jgi:hypothetical protein
MVIVVVNIRDAEGRLYDDVPQGMNEAINEGKLSTLARDGRTEAIGCHKMLGLRVVQTLIEERGGPARLSKMVRVARRTMGEWRGKMGGNADWIRRIPSRRLATGGGP